MPDEKEEEKPKSTEFKWPWLADLDWLDPMDAETNTVKANTAPAKMPFDAPEGWYMLRPEGQV